MKSKRSKLCDITQGVKQRVWERDCYRCIMCGSGSAMPNAHYIPRSKGGLGVEQNIVTLCIYCHYKTDQTTEREKRLQFIKDYLSSHYKDWREEDLIFKK